MKVVHVVLVKWSTHTPAAHRESARRIARGLPERIPGIESLSEGPSVSPEGLEQGHDYALVVTFASSQARDAYLPHPAHEELTTMFDNGAIDVATVFDLDV